MEPDHIAIILDGNGRYAKIFKKKRLWGHRKGAENLEKIIKVSLDLKIKYLTLFCFSTENYKRPKLEVEGIFLLLVEYLEKNKEKLIEKNICLRTIGRTDRIEKNVLKSIETVKKLTEKNAGLTLTLAIDYGYHDELKRAYSASNGNYDLFLKSFDTSFLPDVDLLIRTGGEKRISNFIANKLLYAELFFTDTFWPAFSKEEFLEAILWFKTRTRRFGGLSA